MDYETDEANINNGRKRDVPEEKGSEREVALQFDTCNSTCADFSHRTLRSGTVRVRKKC